MTELIKIPVVSFRKVESPYEVDGKKSYIAIVAITNLAQELDGWRKINPREPRLNSNVSKKIFDSLSDSPEGFLFKNRGLTLLVKKISFDNKESIISLELSDTKKHGILDGGHTYKIIRNYLEESADNTGEMSYVKIEVLEGFEDLDEAVAIVEARNTSAQVKDESIEELRGHFDKIKEALQREPYFETIAFKDNELYDDGSKKKIDIKDILSYMVCFDKEEYKDSFHPTKAYASKSEVVRHFRDHMERMQKIVPLLPEILRLRDTIYQTLPEVYNKQNGKFGGLTGVIEVSGHNRMIKTELFFIEEKSNYRIPLGFIYPVLAAFRNLIRDENDTYSWKDDPIKFYKSIADELVQRICEQAKIQKNPQRLGKDQTVWRSCYDCVQLAVLKRHI